MTGGKFAFSVSCSHSVTIIANIHFVFSVIYKFLYNVVYGKLVFFSRVDQSIMKIKGIRLRLLDDV